MTTQLKDILFEASQNSTVHVIPNILRAKSVIVKYTLTMFLILSTCACCFFISRSISDFLEYEVVTKISVVNEIHAEFPTITICNLNLISTTEGFRFFKEIYKPFNQLGYVERYVFLNSNAYNLTKEEKESLGLQEKDFFSLCWFGHIPCNEEDFIWYYDPYYGNCFRFNSGINSTGHRIKKKKDIPNRKI